MALSSASAFVQVNVRYKVTGLSQAAKGAGKAAGEFGRFGKIIKQVGQSLIAFKAVDLVRSSLQKVAIELIRSNAQFERFEIQLKVFTGSAEKAADLINFLAFQSTKLAGGLEDLLGGATALATFGIAVKENLTLIADVATATNRAVEDVAIAFGRIVAGDPRTKQFLVTRRGDMAKFNKVLAETGDRLAATRAAFSRFEGVSVELEGSFGRLAENIGDLLFLVAKFVGEPSFAALEKWMKDIVDILRSEIFTGEGGLRKDNVFASLREDMEGVVRTTENLIGVWNDMDKLFKSFYQNKGFQAYSRIMEYIYGPMPGTPPTVGGIPIPEPQTPSLPKPYTDAQLFKLRMEQAAGTQQRILKERMDKRNRFLMFAEDPGLMQQVAGSSALEDLKRMTGGDPKAAIRQADKMWEAIYEGRRDGALEALRAVQEAEDVWNKAWRESAEGVVEDLKEARLKADKEVFEARWMLARNLTNRAVSNLGFIFFGGKNANRSIDDRIEKLREEVNVLDGITAPLTRQEQLLNSIVELESQRVTINQRIGTIVRNVLADIAEAAAKAALLRGLGFGSEEKGGGGFAGLFKGFLGLASLGLTLVPGGVPFVAALQGIRAGFSLADPGLQAGGIGPAVDFSGVAGVSGVPLHKPTLPASISDLQDRIEVVAGPLRKPTLPFAGSEDQRVFPDVTLSPIIINQINPQDFSTTQTPIIFDRPPATQSGRRNELDTGGIVINNPVFFGSDFRQLVTESQEEISRRVK